MLETYHDVDWKAMMEEGEKGMSEEEIRRTNWKKPGKRSKKKQLKEELKQAAALETQCAEVSEPQGSADGAAMAVDEASPIGRFGCRYCNIRSCFWSIISCFLTKSLISALSLNSSSLCWVVSA